MDCDILMIRRYISKLIRITYLLISQLWGCRCELVHIKVLEKVEVEEYQDLLDKLDEAVTSESSRKLIEEGVINTLQERSKLSV